MCGVLGLPRGSSVGGRPTGEQQKTGVDAVGHELSCPRCTWRLRSLGFGLDHVVAHRHAVAVEDLSTRSTTPPLNLGD
ncbi:MAG: hypothetical protein V8Q84_10350 [Bilophila sp.]